MPDWSAYCLGECLYKILLHNVIVENPFIIGPFEKKIIHIQILKYELFP